MSYNFCKETLAREHVPLNAYVYDWVTVCLQNMILRK